MQRRRAQLVHVETDGPLDPDWAPLIAVDEIDEANRLLSVNRLQWRWRWLPTTVLLAGTVELNGIDNCVAL